MGQSLPLINFRPDFRHETHAFPLCRPLAQGLRRHSRTHQAALQQPLPLTCVAHLLAILGTAALRLRPLLKRSDVFPTLTRATSPEPLLLAGATFAQPFLRAFPPGICCKLGLPLSDAAAVAALCLLASGTHAVKAALRSSVISKGK